MKYPESLPEKNKYFEENFIVEHWMFVHELQSLLSQLKPDDWLTPNQIGNLSIGRENVNGIGIIDFSSNEIEFWNKT
jgi:hypothetical protein